MQHLSCLVGYQDDRKCRASSPPVVDHLLKPEALVQCPYNDQAVGVTGGQLVVLLIPRRNDNTISMALQSLVCIQPLPAG